MRHAVSAAAAATAAILLLVGAPAALGDTPPPEQAAQQPDSVDPKALDDSISRVLKRDEFAWRLPRQQEANTPGNFVTRFLDDVHQAIHDRMRAFGRWLEWVIERMAMSRDRNVHEESGSSWGGLAAVLHFAVWVIAAVVICLLAWLLWVNRHGFRRRPGLKARAITVAPDLTSEDVIASQLPEDEWMKMARDLMGRGEFRLAIRALYLAALANLGLRELISIARYKSNRDYQRELRRRAGGQGDLLNAFGESVRVFEGAWYGSHTADEEIVRQFAANIERIKMA